MKAVDAALTSLEEARAHLEAGACAPPSTIRSELERIEERLFALRAAARKYNVAGRRARRAGRDVMPPISR